ncbi:MAG: CRISPR-associated helicase/endonuclease Cas3, partial [Bacillota bacterium]
DEESPLSQVPLTRLGEPSIAVVPLYQIGYDLYLDPEGRRPARLNGELTEGEAKELFLRSVRLSRRHVYNVLSKKDPPPAWRKHPMLRRTRVLELIDGEGEVGKTKIVLDPELGVRYM